MTIVNWTPRKVVLGKIENQPISEPWRLAVEDFESATYLRIVAAGNWTVPDGMAGSCEPDGYAGLTPDTTRLIIPDCPYGALIGRFGGGSAGYFVPTTPPATPGSERPFAIGKYALIKIPTDLFGPLFIGFNCKIRPVTVQALELTVQGGIPTQ